MLARQGVEAILSPKQQQLSTVFLWGQPSTYSWARGSTCPACPCRQSWRSWWSAGAAPGYSRLYCHLLSVGISIHTLKKESSTVTQLIINCWVNILEKKIKKHIYYIITFFCYKHQIKLQKLPKFNKLLLLNQFNLLKIKIQ